MYNFDKIYNRKETNCHKWDKAKQIYKLQDDTEFLPMWIADMDLPIANEIIHAMQQRLQHPIFGYSFTPSELNKSIVQWYKSRYEWDFKEDDIVFHEGVIPAIVSIIETFTVEGDAICISSPVYAPFDSIPKGLNRQVLRCPLIEEEGKYQYDFDLLEAMFKQAKLYILCNPHNPGGIVWDEQTLSKIIELAALHDVLILSDEIHADITFNKRYIPLQSLNNAHKAKIITCIAPTKTFNLASLHVAMMVPSNLSLKQQLQKEAMTKGRFSNNEFGYIAALAAYTQGEQWLQEVLAYIDKNIEYAVEQLNLIEGIRVSKPEGTYLLWIDYRDTGFNEETMFEQLIKIGKIGLEKGSKFGPEGNGFLRMNVACPKAYVEEAVQRFQKVITTVTQ